MNNLELLATVCDNVYNLHHIRFLQYFKKTPNYYLCEIYNYDDLKNICIHYDIKKHSKYKKDELINYIKQCIPFIIPIISKNITEYI